MDGAYLRRITKSNLRRTLLALAAVRTVLGLAAIPLAAALYRRHFVVVVALRPTKEVLLAAGFLTRLDRVEPLAVIVAAIPLAILGVWLFYWLGRAYGDEIQSGEGMPRWVERLLPPRRIQPLCRVLDRKGRRLVVLSRLAAFPSALLAAAAGASNMAPKAFLPADGLGALLSIVEVLAAGYAFGAAYKRAGAWVTGIGAALLVGLLVLLGRWLRRDGGPAVEEGPDDASAVGATS